MKKYPAIFFAGQISGVEGYVESIATGMLAGIFASQVVAGEIATAPHRATALGSLLNYITHADPKKFQPANITFDLLPPLDRKIRDRQQRHKMHWRWQN
jgi:methylenetetrahydrofolate--tRNA-(uracil-5-)-methyltransferase